MGGGQGGLPCSAGRLLPMKRRRSKGFLGDPLWPGQPGRFPRQLLLEDPWNCMCRREGASLPCLQGHMCEGVRAPVTIRGNSDLETHDSPVVPEP